MCIGEEIVSVFYGAADREAFDREIQKCETTAGTMKDLPADNGTTGSVIPLTGSKTTIDTRRLELYQRVRNVRERHLDATALPRSEEHTSELQSLMRISYAVFSFQKTRTDTNKYNLQT